MTETIATGLVRELRARRAEGFDLHRAHVNPGFVELLELAGFGRRFVRAEGLELEDDRGRRYLDFLAGYGVLNLGHNPPAVREALEAVLAESAPGFAQVDCPVLEGMAAEELVRALPEGPWRVFFCSSGAEAVEAGLKLARASTGRRRFVACEGGYHGLTFGALSVTDNARLRSPYGPLLDGVSRIPFDDLPALERSLAGRDVAAFVVEPVQGEGGARVPSAGYLAAAAALCRRHGTLLLADEVQTGLGRTGRFLASDHAGVTPDLVALAKALGGGLVPVGALVAQAEAFDKAYGGPRRCLDHATTFGGGPLAMTAVIATLRVLRAAGLAENAAREGAWLKERLEALARRHAAVAEVRGLGLMLGLKLQGAARGLFRRTPLAAVGRATESLLAQHVALDLIDRHGIVTQTAVNDPGVLKVMPPLTVGRQAALRFVESLDDVLAGASHAGALKHLATEVVRRKLP